MFCIQNQIMNKSFFASQWGHMYSLDMLLMNYTQIILTKMVYNLLLIITPNLLNSLI